MSIFWLSSTLEISVLGAKVLSASKSDFKVSKSPFYIDTSTFYKLSVFLFNKRRADFYVFGTSFYIGFKTTFSA